MSQGLTNAYAEIHYLNQDGYAGSGFLIDEKHLVTCSHVLNDALGDIPLAVGLEITIDLRYQNQKNIVMEVVHFYPVVEGNITANQLEDMALLKFKEAHPPKEISRPAVEYPELFKQDDHPISIYSHKKNNFVDAKNKSHSPEGWLILDTDISVEKGDSGSPIWNKNHRAITGMLVARKRNELTCYAIPTIKIHEAFKEYLGVIETERNEKLEKEDEEYLLTIQNSIEKDFEGSTLFLGKLATECSFPDDPIQNFVRHLTEKCESGTFVDIVQKSQGALSKAWREVNKDKNYEVNGLFRCAEGVVNKLTVFNVNINCLSIQPDQQDQILKIPKIHLETLQIFVSRYSRTKPIIERSNTLSKGLKNHGKTFGLEKGIKASKAVLLILEELAAFLSSNKTEIELDKNNPEIAKKQLAELINTKIEYRKNHPVFEHKESYYFFSVHDKNTRKLI